MNQTEIHKKLMDFLNTIKSPGVELKSINDDISLVQSGLIDSLATLEIISFLEDEFNIDFAETGIDPGELDSIQSILKLITQNAE